MRKGIGLLLLATTVVGGIVFVEYRDDPDAFGHSSATSPDTFRAILGGAGAEDEGAPGAYATAHALERSVPAFDPPLIPSGDLDPKPHEITCVVRPGDTVGALALRHLGSGSKDIVERIARHNHLDDPHRIAIGMTLRIPLAGADRHVVRVQETLQDLALRYFGSAERVDPLFHANPSLAGTDARTALPGGRVVWIPR